MQNNNQAAENCVLQKASQYRYAEEEANGTGSDQVSTFQKTAVYQNYATNRVHCQNESDVSVAYTLVTRGGGHMLSEKSQRTQNGTMFVDLA